MLSKKNILLVSVAGSVISLLLGAFFMQPAIVNCDYSRTVNCDAILVALLLSLFIPIFVFDSAMFLLKEEIFLSWKKLTIFWGCIYAVLVICNPWLHADFSPFSKTSVAFFSFVFYILISLILITYKSIKLRVK